MADPMKWYDASTVTVLTGTPNALAALSGETGSAGSTAQVLAYNEGSGSPTQVGRYVRLVSRNTSPDDWVAEGHDAVDGMWIEARINGGEGVTLSTGPWTKLGPGAVLPLPDLPGDTGAYIDYRTFVPAGEAASTVEISFAFGAAAAVSVPGVSAEGGSGIVLGIGDGSVNKLLYINGDVVENPSAADNQVQIQDLIWIGGGRMRSKLQHLQSFNDVDGDSATLASGEAYIAGLSLATDGTVTVIKGSKGATPLATSDRPAAPSGEPVLAWVTVPFSAVINDAEITNVHEDEYGGLTSSALDITIAPYVALAGDRRVTAAASADASISDGATSYAWARHDEAIEATSTEDPPTDSPLAAQLWEVTTSGGVVTATVDRRKWVGHEQLVLEMIFNTGSAMAVNDYAYAMLPAGRWQVQAYKGVRAGLFDIGTTPTAGATTFDVEYHAGSGTWTTLFTSQTTAVPDRGTSVAWDSTTYSDDGGIPEVLELVGPVAIRGRVAEIPTAGAAPSGGVLAVEFLR